MQDVKEHASVKGHFSCCVPARSLPRDKPLATCLVYPAIRPASTIPVWGIVDAGPCPFGTDVDMLRSSVPLIALFMALTIVGHDVAMAGDAHKVIEGDSFDVSGHHGEPLARDHSPAHSDSSPHPMPAQECSSAVDAGPNRPIELQGFSPSSSMVLPAVANVAANDSTPSWMPPGRAADVQRALLQVFLN